MFFIRFLALADATGKIYSFKISAQKQEKLKQLRFLEEEMNRAFQDLTDLEEEELNETGNSFLL